LTSESSDITIRLATSADVKASYERIIRPPTGVVSARKSYYEDFGDILTPDDHTVVFKMKTPVAGVLELLASPFNCIYSAAKLKKGGDYPAKDVMGSGAFEFVEHGGMPRGDETIARVA